jgi:hypothetical protein
VRYEGKGLRVSDFSQKIGFFCYFPKWFLLKLNYCVEFGTTLLSRAKKDLSYFKNMKGLQTRRTQSLLWISARPPAARGKRVWSWPG